MTMKDKRYVYVVLDNGRWFNGYGSMDMACAVAYGMSCVSNHEFEVIECLYPVTYDVYDNEHGHYRDELTALEVRQFCDSLYYDGHIYCPETWAK